jgi:Fe-S-cluster formation regulator IscX/YfhJ
MHAIGAGAPLMAGMADWYCALSHFSDDALRNGE